MASTSILNAAATVIPRGVKDSSAKRLPNEVVTKATMIPLIHSYCQKGPKRRLVNSSDAARVFGSDTFDARKQYATHTTELANRVFGAGAQVVIERIEPADIGPKANVAIWMDVLFTQLPVYQRNSDGTIKRDMAGQPMEVTPAATVPGVKVKFSKSSVNALSDESTFGTLTYKPGTMTDGTTQSTMYPIIQTWAPSRGLWGNGSGFRLWAPVQNSLVPVNQLAMAGTGTYPFRLQVIKRNAVSETARPVETMTLDQFIDFTFKPNVVDPLTDAKLTLTDVYRDHYTHTSNDGLPYVDGELENFHVYTHYIADLAKQFYDLERGLGSNSDFKGTAGAGGAVEGEEWLFNFLSGKHSSGEEYHTFVVDSSGLKLTENTNIYAEGGFDGTMWESAEPLAVPPKQYVGSFAQLVADSMAEYANPNSPLMDTATNLESCFWDSGYPLATKFEACKFIAERKDTFVSLTPFDVNGPKLTAATELSAAQAIRAHLKMYAESDYFGTATCRGMIVGRHGKLIGSQYRKQLPLNIEVAVKAAKMMGSADGRWNEAEIFDSAPNSTITMFEDVNVTWTPSTVRNNDWKMGLNWIQSRSPRELFIPGLQTIYDDDTSVLNSFFVVMCDITLQRIGEGVWRDFSGTVRLDGDRLVERVNEAVNKEVQSRGRFCDMFKIIPRAQITSADKLRGYSWTLVIELYAGVAKTVMTLDVEAKRLSDLS